MKQRARHIRAALRRRLYAALGLQTYTDGYRAGVEASVHLLRHVDTLDKVPGAADGLPRVNPLWDAAGVVERELGS